jgi:hypothetical protein
MTNQLFPTPPRAFDRNGEPLAGAKAYVYQTGTMTDVTVTDSAGTPLPWPVIADLNGTFPQMFYAGAYELKLIITDSDGLIQPGYPIDPVALTSAAANEASAISFEPTAEAPSLTVQGALEDLSDDITTLKALTITGAGLATGGGSLSANRVITVTAATKAEAETGTATNVAMNPLRTAQAITELAPAAVPLGKVFTSTDQTITSAGLLTLAHGLGAAPDLVGLYLVCQTTEANWAVNDVVHLGAVSTTTGANRITSVYADATNVYVRFTDTANAFALGDKTTGVAATLTNANWKLRVRAWV